MNLTQTTTPVHSPESQLHQRWETYIRDQYKLSALCLLAQLWIGHNLYLIDRVGTPAYLSLLLFLLPLGTAYLLSRVLSRCASGQSSALTALLPTWLGRALEILLSLSLLADAVLILCGAVSLLGEMLPTLRRYVIAPLFTLTCLLTIVRNKPFALIRLAGYLFFPLLFFISAASAPALTQGNASHFFPLLGSGTSSILQGALWLCGNTGAACLPLLMPGEKNALDRMRQRKKHRGPLYLLLGLVFAVLIAAMYTYLMPPYALSRQLPVGGRLLLPAQISSSVPGWTLFVCSQLLLFMVAYTGAISRCGTFLWGGCSQEKHCPDWLLIILFIATLPVAMLYSHDLQNILIDAAPWRAIPYALAILCGGVGAAVQKIKGDKKT